MTSITRPCRRIGGCCSSARSRATRATSASGPRRWSSSPSCRESDGRRLRRAARRGGYGRDRARARRGGPRGGVHLRRGRAQRRSAGRRRSPRHGAARHRPRPPAAAPADAPADRRCPGAVGLGQVLVRGLRPGGADPARARQSRLRRGRRAGADRGRARGLERSTLPDADIAVLRRDQGLRRQELLAELERTAHRDVICVAFNAWRYEGSEQVWAGLARAITERLESAPTGPAAFGSRLAYSVEHARSSSGAASWRPSWRACSPR